MLADSQIIEQKYQNALGIKALGVLALGMLALGILALGIYALGILTLGIMALSIMTLGQSFAPQKPNLNQMSDSRRKNRI